MKGTNKTPVIYDAKEPLDFAYSTNGGKLWFFLCMVFRNDKIHV